MPGKTIQVGVRLDEGELAILNELRAAGGYRSRGAAIRALIHMAGESYAQKLKKLTGQEKKYGEDD